MPELEEETALANIALDLLGQARMLLARAAGDRGHHRGRAGVLPRRERVPQRPPGRAARRRLRRTRRPAARSSAPGGSRCSSGCATRAIRCSPRSPARASRSSPTTATTPRSGSCGSATAPTCRARKIQAALDVDLAAGRRAVRAVRRPGASTPSSTAPRSTSCSTPSSRPPRSTARACRRAAAVAGRTGRDGVHTEALGYVLAELQSIARSYPDAEW